VQCRCCLCVDQIPSDFIKNILICFPKKNEGLMGTTRGWVVNDRNFIFGWTNPWSSRLLSIWIYLPITLEQVCISVTVNASWQDFFLARYYYQLSFTWEIIKPGSFHVHSTAFSPNKGFGYPIGVSNILSASCLLGPNTKNVILFHRFEQLKLHSLLRWIQMRQANRHYLKATKHLSCEYAEGDLVLTGWVII